MDNDGIHKFAYGHDALFADLMRLAAPALAAELDFTRAELLPTSHVSAGAPRMKQRHGDMMWRVPRRRGANDDISANLIVVVEFQATVDWGMAQRMRDYRRMVRESLQRRLSQESSVRRRGEGPLATLPLVVYNGSERWTAPGAVAELSAWSPEARLVLAPFQDWDYVLLSLERLLAAGGGDLAHLPQANRSAATLRLQIERTPADLLARLRAEWLRFPGAADRPTRDVLHTWTGALLANMGSAESMLPSVDELEGLTALKGGQEMATVSEARLGKWFEEVRAEHVALGVEQGIQRGVEQERARSLARLQPPCGDQVRRTDGRALGGPARCHDRRRADRTRERLDNGVRSRRRSPSASVHHAGEGRHGELSRRCDTYQRSSPPGVVSGARTTAK